MRRRLGLTLALALAAPAAHAGPPSGASLASCRRAATQHPAERESWGCFYDHARVAGDFAESADALRTSLAEVGELEPTAHGYALLALANLVGELDNPASIELYEEAAEELERGDDSLALTLTLLNLSFRHRVAGSSDRSAEVLRAAERAAAAHGDPRWIATVAVERVRDMLRSSGDLGEAWRVLADVEALLFPDGDYQAQLSWLNAAATVHHQLGRLDEARAAHERLIALAEAADDGYVEASARYNRLIIVLEQARQRGVVSPSDEQVAEVERAIEVAERGGNRFAAAPLRCIQSDLLAAQDRLDEAEASARRCAEEARALGDPRLEADGTLAVLDVLLDADELDTRADEAEALIAEARRIAAGNEEFHLRYAVDAMAAELRWRSGTTEQAIAASEAVLATLEQMRVEQSDPVSRAELLGAFAESYERFVDHLLRAGLLVAAFDVAERRRARVLLESLRSAGARADPDPELLRQFSAVQRRLGDPRLPADERASLIAELEALERRELASATGVMLPADPSTLAGLQEQLGANEAVLAFQISAAREFDERRRGSWVMVVTRDSVRAVELTMDASLRARIELFGPLVEERGGSIDAAGASLWSALLADALAELPEQVDTLHLILDGALHRLPFAALRASAGAPTLGQRYALSVVPSAGVLSLWRRDATPPSNSSVLALGDPATSSDAAWPWAEAERDAGKRSLAPLPFARREAELVAHGPDDLAWVGADASEAALASAELERFVVLHFATHAIVDEGHPSRSAIVLARGSDEDDGLLQAREIAAMDLHGKLVVLSACSSVGDRVIEGEGVMGLAHALFESGARVVVGGLWELRDDEALALFERFHAELDAGSSVAEALARAQRELAAGGAEPAAWAGVVVLGDGAFVPFPGGRRRTEAVAPEPEDGRSRDWVVALLGLVIVGGLVGWRIKRS